MTATKAADGLELTRDDTRMLQGLCACAMVCLHLFCTLDYSGRFEPLVFVWGLPLSFCVGQLGDFCVFGYAFCSGYGHVVRDEEPDAAEVRKLGLVRVLSCYWTVLVVFSLISAMSGNAAWMPGSPARFVLVAAALDTSYNGAWWYVSAYALIVAASPAVLRMARKNPRGLFACSLGMYCASYWLRFRIAPGGIVLSKVGPAGMSLAEYAFGAVCCRCGLVSRARTVWMGAGGGSRLIVSSILLTSLLWVRTCVVRSLFVAPVSGAVVMLLFVLWEKPAWVASAFPLLGKHSTNIWLTHMFFYLRPFEGLAYVARWPIAILAFMLALTIATSCALLPVEQRMYVALSRRFIWEREGKRAGA